MAWNITVYVSIGSTRTVEVIWGNNTQNVRCRQILILVTYIDRGRHGIMYCKGFWGNKPQVHIPPVNNCVETDLIV